MIKKIIKYRLTSLLFLAAFAFVAGGFGWAWVALSGVSGPLVLHFSDMEGITSVGAFSNLIYMGILGLMFVVINFLIALEFEERDRVLGKIVAGTTVIMSVLLFLGFVAILRTN